jgi:hypothetical protein
VSRMEVLFVDKLMVLSFCRVVLLGMMWGPVLLCAVWLVFYAELTVLDICF